MSDAALPQSVTPPAVSSADRLGVAFLFSLIVHGVLVLGLVFEFAPPRATLPALDVTLVRTANGEAPETADFLAQASNRGGGDSDTARRPSQPFSSTLPKPEQGIAPQPLQPSAPAPQPQSGPHVLTANQSATTAASQPQRDLQAARDLPLSQADIERRVEMANLAAEIRRSTEHYAKRPHRKYISANTREYAYAAYMRGWVSRIERIGNLNYPEQARARKLQGDLVLTVGLYRDGRVKSVDVIQSSGHKLLDDAAIRIVHMAAPFPAIPTAGNSVDELYITRTWQFLPGGVLRNR
ncbi:MAG TPA: TonB family protein [Rhodanobacteraceae bacterium]|nr:TonB family protein [Rhodanobacteraceae bacterium]